MTMRTNSSDLLRISTIYHITPYPFHYLLTTRFAQMSIFLDLYIFNASHIFSRFLLYLLSMSHHIHMYYVRKRAYFLRIMSKSVLFAFLFLASLRLVSPHFNIFEMFGQQQQQQQQQQQHKSGHAYSDSGVSIRNCPCTS